MQLLSFEPPDIRFELLKRLVMHLTFIFDLNPEWIPIKEKRRVEAVGGPTTITVSGLKRKKDGFRITHELWESLGHGMPDIFRCKTNSGDFRFAAQRLKVAGNVTETYAVFLDSNFTDKEQCIAYAKDIESALFLFPPVRSEYKLVSLEKVRFYTNGIPVSAKELKDL